MPESAALPAPSVLPTWARGVTPVLIALAMLAVGQWLLGDSPFFVYIASIVGVNAILAVSLNIVNGMTGQFSIGHAGFMAVGAFIAGKVSLASGDMAISPSLNSPPTSSSSSSP